jgi:hypothetical protein
MNALMATHPKVSKGARSVVEVCAAAWIDLLGYGSMLRKAGFDPTSPEAEAAVQRLDCFQELVATAATKYSTALVINDGAVICRDLSARTVSVTFDFIRRVVDLHRRINLEEHAKDLPGARCVIAAGFRVRSKKHYRQGLLDGYGARLISKIDSGEITASEGIKSAITVKPFLATVPETRANFAFTKAYLVDQAGSAAGFSGPRLFLDTSLLKDINLSWLTFDEYVDWTSPGLKGRFGVVRELNVAEAGRINHRGCCDAFEVAQALSGSPAVLERLRKLRIRGTSR